MDLAPVVLTLAVIALLAIGRGAGAAVTLVDAGLLLPAADLLAHLLAALRHPERS